MTKIEQLKDLLARGEFHHATYRDLGKVWEGLHVYRRDASGFCGYSHAGLSFLAADPQLEAAWDLVRDTGISVGSFGQG